MIQKSLKLFGQTLSYHCRNDGDEAIAHEVLVTRAYRLCDKVIQEAKGPILDIGGHAGFFALYAHTLNAKVPIYSFEPHAGNYALLKQNLKENRVKNVQVKQVAVGKEQKEIGLQISREDLNHSTTQALEPTGEIQKVQQTTLEWIFKKNRIEHCDLIKMDCEGAEFEILYHAPEEVFQKTSHLFLEYHDWAPGQKSEDLKRFLEKKGYRVEWYPEVKFSIGYLWCVR